MQPFHFTTMTPGVQGGAGWGFEQPDLVEYWCGIFCVRLENGFGETLGQQSSKAMMPMIPKRFSFSRGQTLNKNWSSVCSDNPFCHDKCPWLSWAMKLWQGGCAKVWELCGHLFVSHFYRLSLRANHTTHQLERLGNFNCDLAILDFNLTCTRAFLNNSEFLQVKQLCVQFRGSVMSPVSLQCDTEGKLDKRACSNIQVVMNRRKILGSWFSMSSLIQTGKERNLKGHPVLLLPLLSHVSGVLLLSSCVTVNELSKWLMSCPN